MSGHCSNPGCYPEDGLSCALGLADHRKCKHWKSDPKSAPHKGEEKTEPTSRVPWSGSPLGLADLSYLLPQGRSIMIGVLGSPSAGKTTLLTGNYLQLLAGKSIAEASFAGSRTLEAWESLATFTRFKTPIESPTFPPHTPRQSGRIPGILHFALRGPQNDFRDILLTDAPGEWFSSWAIDEEGVQSKGADWIVKNSDAFLIFADCDRLSQNGKERGQARRETRQLIERLARHIERRPVVLVWAKSDKTPNETIQAAIQTALKTNLPHASEAETTVDNPESLNAALGTIIKSCWTPNYAAPLIEPIVTNQPFEAFRGHNG